MVQIALLAGSRPLAFTLPDNAVALPPPPPPQEHVVDVTAAVRDALGFPLSGESLAELAHGARRATIVVEPPALPVPGATRDPRTEALVAVSDELERIGIPTGFQTILVAAGLARRPGRHELETLVTPEFARRFHGLVSVHDAENPGLLDFGAEEGIPLRINPALVETDLVVVVAAAESALHGGPGVLLAAGGPEALRAAQDGPSLLETGGSRGWRLGLALERVLGRSVPLVGVALALGPPRLGGFARGYPFDARAVGRIARSPLRRLLVAIPAPLRWRLLVSSPTEIVATAIFAGSPSVAQAEALLAAIEARATEFTDGLDVLCVPVPDTTLFLPRERPNPLAVAAFGLGYALRRWRERSPLKPGGAIVLVHGFERRFPHPGQQPYRAFFAAARAGGDAESLDRAAEAARADPRALALYRNGRSCHPLTPFADWDACRPAIGRAGRVIVADCRDAFAARQLGFVPSHSIAHALELATGGEVGAARIGFVLGPPYPALRPAAS
jgi:hypothetical protein